MYESIDCVAKTYIMRDRNSKSSNNIYLAHKVKVGSYYVVLMAKRPYDVNGGMNFTQWDHSQRLSDETTADWMVTYSESAGADVILVQWISASSEEYFDTIK